jgi:hypothetical protein
MTEEIFTLLNKKDYKTILKKYRNKLSARY